VSTALAPARAGAPAPQRARAGHAFRHDVHGLRAVAVLLVVLYHAGVPGITGGYVGVDVFFVISGYLITSLLLREIASTGRVSLPAFYARRVRRLLPAAGVVVAVTLVAGRVWGPALQVAATAWDAVWTSGYAINFRLGARGVDYLAASETASPLQHFWSLAVEEQFYLVWPLLLLGASLLAARTGRRAVPLVVAAVAVAGFVYSVHLTQASAPTAYFASTARAWELAAGALVALAASRLARLPAAVAVALSWAGLALVVAGAVVLDDATPFPGTAALLPVVGASAVIAAGCGAGSRAGGSWLLDRRPMQRIGTLSYGWYLWHWPVLVLAPGGVDGSRSWIVGVGLSVLSLGLAWLTYVAVEQPAMRGSLQPATWLRRGLAISGGVVALALLLVATAPRVVGSGTPAGPLRVTDAASLSAALTAAARTRALPSDVSPTLDVARADRPASDGVCHRDFADVDVVPCAFGDPRGTRTVVLLGDSHAQQWLGALDEAARQRQWRVVPLTKAACPVAELAVVNPTLKREYTECSQWRARALDAVVAARPELVLVSQSDAVPGTSVDNGLWAERTVVTLDRLRQQGLRVVFLRDTPFPRSDVPACLEQHLADARACGVPRADAYNSSELFTDRHERVASAVDAAGFRSIEPAPWLCTSTFCPVVVGDELVYRDDSHLTDTYSRTLAPLLAPLLR
jgi:peptidoglycan/LPS O-acetylase OafA/YrhL